MDSYTDITRVCVCVCVCVCVPSSPGCLSYTLPQVKGAQPYVSMMFSKQDMIGALAALKKFKYTASRTYLQLLLLFLQSLKFLQASNIINISYIINKYSKRKVKIKVYEAKAQQNIILCR